MTYIDSVLLTLPELILSVGSLVLLMVAAFVGDRAVRGRDLLGRGELVRVDRAGRVQAQQRALPLRLGRDVLVVGLSSSVAGDGREVGTLLLW